MNPGFFLLLNYSGNPFLQKASCVKSLFLYSSQFKMKKLFFLLLVTAIGYCSLGQNANTNTKGWHLKDKENDGYQGISLQKAYALLQGKKSHTVVVAVIDSGIDTLQNDIKDVFWTNPGEIPNNNIDDDKNGYIDDVQGWNFLGSPSGENLSVSVPEAYRTYHRFKDQFEGKKYIAQNLQDSFLYNEWQRAAKIINDHYQNANENIINFRANLQIIQASNNFLIKEFGKPIFTRKDLHPQKAKDSSRDYQAVWLNIFDGRDFSNTDFVTEYENFVKKQETYITQKTTTPIDFRDLLLKDDAYDISKTRFGNTNLQTHSGYHGTSTSGIIGAIRNNQLGIDGIADNVRIMMVRAILGEDEYDKDVALAIRYAVDNGAQVINMSFGKPISPDKSWVDDAIRYAQSKDVVLVHASGNEGKDIDIDFFYPNAFYLDGSRMPHFINVGASGDAATGGLAVSFSNYGKKMVDVFAPGIDIECSIANNGTQVASGTSLASPIVAGLAALIRSYFPSLTAPQIVDIIKTSGTTMTKDVLLPGNKDKKVSFQQLCETGKIVNAYKAIQMAAQLAGQ